MPSSPRRRDPSMALSTRRRSKPAPRMRRRWRALRRPRIPCCMPLPPGTGYRQAARRPSGCRRRLPSLAKASPEVRSKAEAALIIPLKITLSDIRQSLHPEKSHAGQPASGPCFRLGSLRTASATGVGNCRGAMSNNNTVLWNFVDAVAKVAPDATGEAVGIVGAGETIVQRLHRSRHLGAGLDRASCSG